MKVLHHCVVCESNSLDKKLGQFAPFISHRVFDFPIINLQFGETSTLPFQLTNSLHCHECGFVFSQIRFDEDELSRIYAGYRGEEYTRVRSIFEPNYAQLNDLIGNNIVELTNRQLAIAEFITGVVDKPKVRTVLDYGGDKGQHIPFEFFRCERYVYDISNVGTEEGVKIVNNLDGLGPIDFIMASNVFEHLPYPRAAMDHIKSVCGKDSYVFIDVPLEMSDSPDIAESEVPAFFHEHINFFNSKAVSALFTLSGFTLLKMAVIPIDLGWTEGKAIYAIGKLT